jgi:hypothetical protein
MKLLLCIAILLGGCSISKIGSYKKPDNTIHNENLQEKFDKIDKNNDGVIDKTEARKHEETKAPSSDLLAPTWAFLLIMGFMAFACILPMSFAYIAGKIRDFREKKRV